MNVKFDQRKITLLLLIVLGTATGIYFIISYKHREVTAPAATPAVDTISVSDSIPTSPPDTVSIQPVLKDTVIPKRDSTPEAKKPEVIRSTGTLRLQSAQGYWFEYTGDIVNGEAHGKGSAVFENGNRYEGEFRHNKRSGYGIAINKNGDRYEGQWKNDRFNGKGVYTWKNGDRFEGYFRDAQRNGKGKLFNKQGELLKEGEWKNDELVKKP
jgi:hypothetical protein